MHFHKKSNNRLSPWWLCKVSFSVLTVIKMKCQNREGEEKKKRKKLKCQNKLYISNGLFIKPSSFHIYLTFFKFLF